MGRHTKEWNEGYQAAIEAIKQALNGGNNSNSGSGGQSDNLPSDMQQPPVPGAGGGSGSGSDKKQNNGSDKGAGGSGNSRTNKNDSSQGIVRPEDCASNNSGISNTPSTAGGFFEKSEGDKLAESEGYAKDGGSESSIENEWKDAALRAANDMKNPGDAWGRLKSTIEGLYKVSTDWKRDLKYVVGKSINDAEKRQAYANKNILAAQGRMARTDKDKYDNMDYMIAFIDSSGSMSDEQLKMVLSETYALACAKKPVKLITIQCDTRIQEIKEYKTLKELKQSIVHASVKGRGGTDVKPLWDFLKTDPKFRKKRPDLIMIFTDGYVPKQYNRDRTSMSWLCWCIIDNPSFTIQYNDQMTKVIHLKSNDIK